jgi:hypothetical protein
MGGRMIAVAVAVIVGVVAVTCGIVADSNHADTLTFLGVMVKTTAAQIFLSGAICTWALFASLWLLSVGVRRSKERGIELRALKALRSRGIISGPDAGREADTVAGICADTDADMDTGMDTDTEPTVTLDFDHLRVVIEAELAQRAQSGRFYRADSAP